MVWPNTALRKYLLFLMYFFGNLVFFLPARLVAAQDIHFRKHQASNLLMQSEVKMVISKFFIKETYSSSCCVYS